MNATDQIVRQMSDDRMNLRIEIARKDALIEAFKAVPLYSVERNWGVEDDPDATIEICNGCGFPKRFDHDGQKDCPVAVVERLLSEN